MLERKKSPQRSNSWLSPLFHTPKSNLPNHPTGFSKYRDPYRFWLTSSVFTLVRTNITLCLDDCNSFCSFSESCHSHPIPSYFSIAARVIVLKISQSCHLPACNLALAFHSRRWHLKFEINTMILHYLASCHVLLLQLWYLSIQLLLQSHWRHSCY